MNPAKRFAIPAGAALTLLLSGFFPNDGFATEKIESFQPEKIVQERLWQESPVQLINTFFLGDTRIWGLGGKDATTQQLQRRLGLNYGAAQIDSINSHFELYQTSPSTNQEELDLFRGWLTGSGYYSEGPCPHDESITCEIGLAWNRDVTRTRGVELIFLRTGEREYTFVDSSIVGSPGE